MSKHTPGKWRVVDDNPITFWIVGDNDCGNVCTTPGATEEDEANARLISAAPELLGALKKWRIAFNEKVTMIPDTDEAKNWFLNLQGETNRAISKAEGRQ